MIPGTRAIGRATMLCCVAASAWGTTMNPPVVPDALDLRLKRLESELRCLVCQNQTLADSNASLAEDLRVEVRALATAGKNDDEIRAYLVARYGDFVLYDPPLKPTTWLLWLGPFALLVGGTLLWWGILRRRAQPGADTREASAEAERRARALLENASDHPPH